jgi:hypothetical protein
LEQHVTQPNADAWGFAWDEDPERLPDDEDFHIEGPSEPDYLSLLDRLGDPKQTIRRQVDALVAANRRTLPPYREDLLQIARIALFKADGTWDPDRGAAPETFATTVVRNALTDWVRSREGGDALGREPWWVEQNLKLVVPWVPQAIKLPRSSTDGVQIGEHRYLTTDNGQLEALPPVGSSGASGPDDPYLTEPKEEPERWPDGLPVSVVDLSVCPGPGRTGRGCGVGLGRNQTTCGGERCRKALQQAIRDGRTWWQFLKTGSLAASQFEERTKPLNLATRWDAKVVR